MKRPEKGGKVAESRRLYRTPELELLGTLEELTRSGGAGMNLDGGINTATSTSTSATS